MKAFIDLYESLDSTTATLGKVEAMVDYFREASALDAAWVVFFLSGQRIKRLISSRKLAGWFQEVQSIPEWLFQECYLSVGDTAETIALMNDTLNIPPTLTLPRKGGGDINLTKNKNSVETSIQEESLANWLEKRILPLGALDESEQKTIMAQWWQALDRRHVFMLNKLLSGAFRVGVSQGLLIRALTEVSGIESAVLTHRMMGNWQPSEVFYQQLIAAETGELSIAHISRPYPFFLAYPLEQPVESLGPIEDWLLEWKWDGIRAQYVFRGGQVFIWSRGEELMVGRFPELEACTSQLPSDIVLDGEILAFSAERPLPFAVLQTRIGRKKITPKVMSEAPVVFMAYDILEFSGQDIRQRPLRERREILSTLIEAVGSPFMESPSVVVDSWEMAETIRAEARQRQVEGLMLKRLNSTYQHGRKKGDWWKWKLNPYTVDAVLIYAQAGTGRRANLFTDYTFAVWHEGNLVPVAKAYSGLSNEEIQSLDRWIRSNTKEKFGPVRSVDAHHVFEIGFEGISESKRHKSGVALRFPRILRWRMDKTMEEANTLDDLRSLLHAQGDSPPP